MAQPTTQVENLRQSVRTLFSALNGIEEAKENIVLLGGQVFVVYLDDPSYDITSADVVAVVPALAALDAALDAVVGSSTHRKNLAKLL